MSDLGQPQSPFAASAGIKVTEASAEGAVAVLEVTERHCNSQGTIHGGVIFTLAD